MSVACWRLRRGEFCSESAKQAVNRWRKPKRGLPASNRNPLDELGIWSRPLGRLLNNFKSEILVISIACVIHRKKKSCKFAAASYQVDISLLRCSSVACSSDNLGLNPP